MCARPSGTAHTTLGAEMTGETSELEDPVALVFAELDCLKSLVSDLLGMMVAVDPGSMAEMRDAAFRQVALADRVVGPGNATPEAVHYRLVIRTRAQMLECVVARAGSPWVGTPLINLAEVRAAKA